MNTQKRQHIAKIFSQSKQEHDNILHLWLARMQTEDHQQNECSFQTPTLEYSGKGNIFS